MLSLSNLRPSKCPSSWSLLPAAPQTFAQAPISISVADAERIADHNAFSLTGPLRYVSGISQVGSQPVVRGSSGTVAVRAVGC